MTKLSRSEINTKAENVFKRLPREKRTPYNRAVLIATLQYFNDVPIDQYCPTCKGIVSAEGNEVVMILSCPCGLTKETLRGL